ncbi:MAG: DUF3192 domain-containing protein [Gammaproteobacteria bacterium]|nr:DUF3192 domain-containing protein [Gammaproteobacteria bacterium]
MIIKKMLISIALLSLLSGCIIVDGDGDREGRWDNNSDWEDKQNKNMSHINNLRLGMDRTVVTNQMGTPTFSEAFQGDDGSNYSILFYRTHRTKGDGKTTKDETTPLVFKNDKLFGWGNDALLRAK